jgi:hypothetical protein
MASLRMTHGRTCQEKARTAPEALANPKNDPVLMKSAVHSHFIGHKEGALAMAGQQVSAKVKKHVLVPVEEEVQVPVVRKETVKRMGTKTIQCQRLVPVIKYKEVEETTLETRVVVENGRKEKRAIPITQKRMQPYQDFEEELYDMEVKVPIEEVVTRTGTRTDKQVTGKIVEVEEEHIYELRPVLVGKGDVKHRQIGDHHKFKHEHGKPTWDDDVKRGWIGKPQTPLYKPHLHRPRSSCSVLGTMLDKEKNLGTKTDPIPSGSRLGFSRSGSDSRPRSGVLKNSASDTMLPRR